MGVLFGFFVGWAVGARGGVQGYQQVVVAAREVLRSEEAATLQAVLRVHAEHTLRQLADWLQDTRESGDADGDLDGDIMARVRRLVLSETEDGAVS